MPSPICAACTPPASREALQRAKANVERLYPVVGVLERMEDTLEVMEAVLPKAFGEGIKELYRGENV